MRYPGLPQIGRAPDESALDRAWSQLGGVLDGSLGNLADLAAEAMDRQDLKSEIIARLGIAEARRRISADTEAFHLAHSVQPLAEALGNSRIVLATILVRATAGWDAGLLKEASAALDDAETSVASDVDRAITSIARSRVLRYQSRHAEAYELASDALRRVDGVDADATADAQRELSAILIMQEDLSSALPLARAAFDFHHAAGDLYRSGMAQVLAGRALGPDRPMERADALRQAGALGNRIGSPALELAALLNLSQLLQTGATPDSDEFAEADRHLRRLSSFKLDGIGLPEVALTQAHLEIARFDPSGDAEALLNKAQAVYSAMGNTVGIASSEKARARLLVQRASSQRGKHKILVYNQAVAAYARSGQAYAKAGMAKAQRRLGVEKAMATSWVGGRGAGAAAAAELLKVSDPADPKARSRALLLQSEDLLRTRPKRRLQDQIASWLNEAAALADESGDVILMTAAAFGKAELAALMGAADAKEHLERGLDLLASVDGAILGSPGRARFVDSIEWVTLRALRAATAIGDGEAGLYLLEVRRSGRLAGLFRRQGQLTIESDIAGLLGRIEWKRQVNVEDLQTDADESSDTNLSADELREELAAITSDAFAAVYDPEPVSRSGLFEAVPEHVDLLLIDQTDLTDPGAFVAVAARRDGTDIEIHAGRLPDDLVETLTMLASDDTERDGERASVKPAGLAKLQAVLPPRLADRLRDTTNADVLIVPSGLFWTVPWPAVPIGKRLLVDAAAVTVTPSLRVHALASRSPGGPITGKVLTWAGDVYEDEQSLPELSVFDECGLARIRPLTAQDAWDRIIASDDLGAIALAVHGDAGVGLSHGIELEADLWLRAFDLLGANLPPYLLLGACHGGFAAGEETGEPIGLATVALCAGARSVVAAGTKIPDDEQGSAMLAFAYRQIVAGTHPARALRDAFIQELRDTVPWDQPVIFWASMAAIGAAPARPSDLPSAEPG